MPSFIQFLFQVETWREKYRKKEAVSLTTKFNSASGPVYCLAAGCRGRFILSDGRLFSCRFGATVWNGRDFISEDIVTALHI